MEPIKPAIKEDRRLQILAGALKVFSQRGYADSSIKDIAAASGIGSAALIYHYFINKEDLLRAVILQYTPPLKLMANPEAMNSLPVREALLKFAKVYLTIMDDPQIAACIRVMVSEAILSPEFAAILGESVPQRIWAILAAYFSTQTAAGTLRITNPQLAARCFLSPLFNHVFVRTIARLPDPMEIDSGEFAAFCVDMFLYGCGVTASEQREDEDHAQTP